MIRVPTRWLARCMVEFGITQGEVTPPLNLFPSFIQTPLVKRQLLTIRPFRLPARNRWFRRFHLFRQSCPAWMTDPWVNWKAKHKAELVHHWQEGGMEHKCKNDLVSKAHYSQMHLHY